MGDAQSITILPLPLEPPVFSEIMLLINVGEQDSIKIPPVPTVAEFPLIIFLAIIGLESMLQDIAPPA